MLTTEKLVRQIVTEHPDEEVGTPGTAAYAAILRADLLEIANDIGYEIEAKDKSELEGVVGAIVFNKEVFYFRDEVEMDDKWSMTTAHLDQ